ncbi:MAG TPA: DUF4115 domain-containing protein, partial [Thermoanaerobaculia bacterium]|nr:DUF4115 domain-containing protein [Thermoanaerobaculia bacterium]
WAIRTRTHSRDGERVAETATIAPASAVPAAPTPESATPPASDVLRLTMELTSDSWIVLDVDGKNVINDVVRQGERRSFEAQDRFRFRRIGNAGGVVLTLNDQRLPPLGEEGEVIKEKVFDRSTVEPQSAPESRSTT